MHSLNFLLLPCLLLSLFFGTLAQSSTQPTLLPKPPGSANVHVTHFPLTDTSRIDPFAPCCDEPRRLMLSLYQPATCEQTVGIPYAPPTSAAAMTALFGRFLPNISFNNFELQVCADAPVNNTAPLLIFSPGGLATRLAYGVMLQWVASMGFNVLSIDHPYDGTIVEYPDGSYVDFLDVFLNGTLMDAIPELLAARVADVTTVLDAITNPNATQWLTPALPLPPSINTTRLAIFGHSLGGATALSSLLAEPTRLIAGLNIDGGLWESALNTTNDKPFVLMTHEKHNHSSFNDFWPYQTGPKWRLDVNGTKHNSFIDFNVLASFLTNPSTTSTPMNLTDPATEAFIGTIEPIRLVTILREYISAFFREMVQGVHQELWEGESWEFPEVKFVKMAAGRGQACH